MLSHDEAWYPSWAALDATEDAEARLHNQLARVVGHCDLLADDPSLSEDARERARRAVAAAFEASETLRAFVRAARAPGASPPAVGESARAGGAPQPGAFLLSAAATTDGAFT